MSSVKGELMSVETKDCIYLSRLQKEKAKKSPLICNWLIKEMISKNIKGVTTNLEWDEIQITKSYLKVKNFKTIIIVRFLKDNK